ncbi:MAG: carbamate kinase [Desulfuromonas sp. SDB]|nr:MAG: carbamate kinase [Desulfuromonas sp. SDB]
MKKKPIAIVALGGNALIRAGEQGTIAQQFANTRRSLDGIIYLLRKGYQVAVTHGNGPQAGNEMIRMERSAEVIPTHPLGVIDASTQGWIGYMISQSLYNRLLQEKLDHRVTAVITQVIVDPNDPSIQDPSKPVGPFYKQDQVEELTKKGWVVKADAGRGYRRVVASPKPKKIVEKDAILALLGMDQVVVTVGGGGIPVYLEEDEKLEGLDAVIDKDRASAVLGVELNAELLLILTGIEKVMINYKQPNEKPIDRMDVNQALLYLKQGEFAPGSMQPKIEAAVEFIQKGGKKVIITELDKAIQALQGKTGTVISDE